MSTGGPGSSGNPGHGCGGGIPMYGASAVGGAPRMSQEPPMNPISHSGLSASSSTQPSGHNPMSMQYGAPSSQMGQAKVRKVNTLRIEPKLPLLFLKLTNYNSL